MKDMRSYMERLLRTDGDSGVDALDSSHKLFLRADELHAIMGPVALNAGSVPAAVEKLAACFRHVVHAAAYLGYSPEELAALSLEDKDEDTYR